VRRLHPAPIQETTVAEAYTVTRTRIATSTGSRPVVGLCMVQSIDGSTVVDGTSLALSGPADREVLLGLRQIADCVLVGAGTVRKEGYGAPTNPRLRVGVVTNSGNVDTTTPLFTSGAGFLVAPLGAVIAPGDFRQVRAGQGTLDLAVALEQIEGTFVQLEGGAALNAAMFAADLVDEITLTVSPLVVGGAGKRLTDGAPDLLRRFRLAHVLEDDGFLFLRYVR
jgi:riboflavin biosynthesis pyrimidine reductase